MQPSTVDLRIRGVRPLIAPVQLEAQLPLPENVAAQIGRSRQQIIEILGDVNDRLLVVVGPCSIHDPDAAIEYAKRLVPVASRFAGELLLVMRVYFEKPRTVVGWKGLINDPLRDGSYEINRGLLIARKLMLEIAALGLPIGTEFLDTTLGQYYAELVTWGAIGARTVESQVHRELASGLSMPVGFKNRTDGDLQVAVNAMRSAGHPHWFPSLTREGVPAIMETTGNAHTHLVLRGGASGPNYTSVHVRGAAELLRSHGLPEKLMIDCSHANSGKDPMRQVVVAKEIAAQLAGGERAICGIMLESHLLAGAQDWQAKPLVYGRSVTDACLGWEDTVPVLEQLAEAVRVRRAAQ